MISILILTSFPMGVVTLKNMEGTEERGFIPVIVSVLVTV